MFLCCYLQVKLLAYLCLRPEIYQIIRLLSMPFKFWTELWMEDKMAAGAFRRATNYGRDGPFKVWGYLKGT